MEGTTSGSIVQSTSPRPMHGWIGVALIAIFWPLNWSLPGLRTHLLFFPLWLGYILVVDALALRRGGASILSRSGRGFGLLFVLSAPAWWLFEVFNGRTGNWIYVGSEHFSDLHYALLSTVSFSTVMPAVFGTAEWVRSFGWIERFGQGPRLRPTRRLCAAMALTGGGMLGLIVVWPAYFYPFVWGSVFFLLEPINVWLDRGSLFDDLQRGDWRPVVALCAGALCCGFFWELWNYYSYPKWTYHTPGVGFWYIFEMPLLGFIGYLPFALELHALLHLATGRQQIVRL